MSRPHMQTARLGYPSGSEVHGQAEEKEGGEQGAAMIKRTRRSWFAADPFSWKDVLIVCVSVGVFLVFLPSAFDYVAWENLTVRILASVVYSLFVAASVAWLLMVFLFAK